MAELAPSSFAIEATEAVARLEKTEAVHFSVARRPSRGLVAFWLATLLLGGAAIPAAAQNSELPNDEAQHGDAERVSAAVVDASCGALESVEQALDRGWSHFADRAVGARGTRAAPEPIGSAVECFERALALAPDRDDVVAALLRALFFQGEYATPSDDERKRIFLEATELFELQIEQVAEQFEIDFRDADPHRAAERVGARRADLGATFFYGALHWGLWAQSYGKMAALRAGVAKRIRDYGELSLAMAPQIADAGPHRLVGQLHAEAPRVVFLTMWIDRKRALQELERAVELSPDDPLNLTYLAEALVEFRRDRNRAAELLQRAVSTPPREHHLVEDRSAIELARSAQRALGLSGG